MVHSALASVFLPPDLWVMAVVSPKHKYLYDESPSANLPTGALALAFLFSPWLAVLGNRVSLTSHGAPFGKASTTTAAVTTKNKPTKIMES
uniref:Uncharacterized protein n=1 Tax=Romanomermis culicivorax TaxID=13658 RepID=A0A915IYW5_ROMCU